MDIQIPDKLKEFRNFVVWGVNPKNPKQPYSPNTMKAQGWDKPENWGTYDEAMARVQNDEAKGIGFCFSDDNDIYGVDLDWVSDDNGDLIPEVEEIAETLYSYTEQSMSCKGLHVFVYAPGVDLLEGLGKGKTEYVFPCYDPVIFNGKEKRRKVEYYQSSGYIAITGKILAFDNDVTSMMYDMSKHLKAIYDKYSNPVEKPQPEISQPEKSNEEYLKIGLEKDPIFRAMWNESRGNESDDDLGFFNKLAYYLNNDVELMLEYALESPRYAAKDDFHQEKWERVSYIKPTILKAIKGTPVTARDKDKAFNAKKKAPADIPKLETISADVLMSTDYKPLRFPVKGLLPQGLALLCAPSKYGKSWFALDLCLSVATGQPFLGFDTEKSGVLYLALEDGHRRLKARIGQIKNSEHPEEIQPVPGNFDLAIAAATLDNGLEQQLTDYLKEKPGTGLIIIDVLQRVRSNGASNSNAYAMDYADIGAIKRIADQHEICVLVIHHLRKAVDNADIYNTISGTNAIMGAADTIFLLHKKTRNDKTAILSMTGRDIEQNDIVIAFDGVWSFKWDKVGSVEEQQEKEAHSAYIKDPIVRTIRRLFDDNPEGFSLTASEFSDEMPPAEAQRPSKIGRAFKRLEDDLFKYDKVVITSGNTKTRKHTFTKHGKEEFLGSE